MKKIRKRISIEDFMKLWKFAQEKKWDKVIPGWGVSIRDIWKEEIMKKFQMSKRHEGSYGHVGDEMLQTLEHHTESTFLPTIEYKRDLKVAVVPEAGQRYIQVFPFSYVWRGYLKREMSKDYNYVHEQDDKSMKLKVNIPLALLTKPDAYEYLEEKR